MPLNHAAFVITIILAGIAHAQEDSNDLIFAAIGDGPYKLEEWKTFEVQLNLVGNTNAIRFLAHVGDIWHGSDSLPSSHYTRVAEILKRSKTPVFIIPGDNEWNDLNDPDVGWENWTREFTNFDANFPGAPIPERQKDRAENFAFVEEGVLFVGINLVGGTVHEQAEWDQRFDHNRKWIKSQFNTHKKQVRTAVIIGHARPAESHEPFFKSIEKLVSKFKKPVLYLHGDGHNFNIQYPWRVSNLWRVQIDSIGKNPPLKVRVTHDAGEPFRFDRTYED